jgi:plastocyanin
MKPLIRLLAVATAVTLVACGGERATPDGESAAGAGAPAAAPAAGGEQTPDAGREIIEVEMLTDDQGNNIFRPAEFEVHRGDVVRFKLVSGVHNVHFVADSNPGATGLPPASDLLQLPGQTYDLKVTLAEGSYYYQCDPHALLGMVGRMKVEDE